MKIYLAGPMRNIPQFNFPAFFKAAKYLRSLGHAVFSPAEHDLSMHSEDFYLTNSTGDNTQATKDFGFDLRKALGADLSWICREADGIALLPQWENSKGANAEKATGVALGLKIMFLQLDSEGNYYVSEENKAAA
jgi:hypothetical protein